MRQHVMQILWYSVLQAQYLVTEYLVTAPHFLSTSCVAELRVVTAVSLRCCGRFFALFAGIVQAKRRSLVKVWTALNELLPGTFHRECHSKHPRCTASHSNSNILHVVVDTSASTPPALAPPAARRTKLPPFKTPFT